MIENTEQETIIQVKPFRDKIIKNGILRIKYRIKASNPVQNKTPKNMMSKTDAEPISGCLAIK